MVEKKRNTTVYLKIKKWLLILKKIKREENLTWSKFTVFVPYLAKITAVSDQ